MRFSEKWECSARSKWTSSVLQRIRRQDKIECTPKIILIHSRITQRREKNRFKIYEGQNVFVASDSPFGWRRTVLCRVYRVKCAKYQEVIQRDILSGKCLSTYIRLSAVATQQAGCYFKLLQDTAKCHLLWTTFAFTAVSDEQYSVVILFWDVQNCGEAFRTVTENWHFFFNPSIHNWFLPARL
jgi:hypothetical protein